MTGRDEESSIVKVVAEREIATYEDANNGAGPLWCYGSPTIVRDGSAVFASVWEVGKGVTPLCNTHWRLFRREDGGSWQLVQAGEFNEREPCPLLRLPGGRIFITVNPAQRTRGTTTHGRKLWFCEPNLLEFSATEPQQSPKPLNPVWLEDYPFVEHSYRGSSADYRTGEILLLNIVGELGHAYSYLDSSGRWSRRGLLRFPLRGCYPQVALRERSACVMAVSDIVEPNPVWRAYKKQITGNPWDYDFRNIFFTYTSDITTTDFSPPLTIATRDESAGWLRNLDMWIDHERDAHLVYLDKKFWHNFMRDRFFPNVPLKISLKYCRVSQGKVVERRLIYESVETEVGSEEWSTPPPTWGALHSSGQNLYFIYHLEGEGNFILKLLPQQYPSPTKLKLKRPLRQFFTASERMGTEPSETIDLLGISSEPHTIHYAQLRLESD